MTKTNVIDQKITEKYAIYNSDCMEVLKELPDKQIHMSIYSPPFCGLFHYSSSERDMSNCRSYEEFMENYEFLVKEIHRVTMPGRLSCVHAMEIPSNGANLGGNHIDFPGDIIKMHQRLGFDYAGRHCIWKEPLSVRNRTMAKGLAHMQVVDDSSLVDLASADFLMLFRKKGTNPIPIAHPVGLLGYAGERQIPSDTLKFKGWKGKQTENRYSHWIWRQYASSFWDDIRLSRTLKYKEARDPEDEAHMHPLQLDVIERCVILRSNPGEIVLTPFLGVGSEVAGAVMNGRKGLGVELKNSYYRQAVKNLEEIERKINDKSEKTTPNMFDDLEDDSDDEVPQVEDED